jgi:hypothetical protein
MKTRIYFIALVPPQEIREEVTQFKLYASEHFNAAHALKSPLILRFSLLFDGRWKKKQSYKKLLAILLFPKLPFGYGWRTLTILDGE